MSGNQKSKCLQFVCQHSLTKNRDIATFTFEKKERKSFKIKRPDIKKNFSIGYFRGPYFMFAEKFYDQLDGVAMTSSLELVNFSLRTNTDELLEKTLYPSNFIDGQIKQ